MNEVQKEITARHSVGVVKRIKNFFNNNEDELLTLRDFNSIQKEAWHETRKEIMDQLREESLKKR